MTIATIEAWAKSRNITSHAIAAVIISAAALYTGDQQVRDFTIQLFHNHPTIPADLLALAGIIMKYSSAHSPAGVVAQAKAVMSSPNPPTIEAVKAATVPPLSPTVSPTKETK